MDLLSMMVEVPLGAAGIGCTVSVEASSWMTKIRSSVGEKGLD